MFNTLAIQVLGIALALWGIAVVGVWPIDAFMYRVWFFAISVILILLKYPLGERGGRKWRFGKAIDLVSILAVLALAVYSTVERYGLLLRAGMIPTTADTILGLILVIIMLDTAWRTTGPALPTLLFLSIIYAVWGKYLPLLAHKGYELDRVLTLGLSPWGAYGVVLSVGTTYLLVYVTFSSFLNRSGVGELLMDLSKALVGNVAGGPAKIAVVASSLFGTISGSSTANVVSTGSFTIPLMKRMGFDPSFAGAVEAVASTGGQLMPPIMGTAAFLMAEYLGISYLTIVKIAIIPALLFYVALFLTVHLRAKRLGISGLDKGERVRLGDVLKQKGYLFIPIIVLIFLLFVTGMSPIRAGLLSTVACIITSYFKRETWMTPRDILDALKDGAMGTATVMPILAIAGTLIGIFGLTGLGESLSRALLTATFGSSLMTLLLVAVTTLILGMGLPTTGAYAITAVIGIPALVDLGFQPLTAHFFVFYFAILSAVTPPVALASYAAAGIADAPASRLGWVAFKLALPGFLIPFVVAYGESLITFDNVTAMITATASALIGMAGLAAALEGWLSKLIAMPLRVVLGFGSLLMIIPGLATDLIGLVIMAIVLMIHLMGTARTAEGVTRA